VEKCICEVISSGKVNHPEGLLVSNMRHKEAIGKACSSLMELVDAFEKGFSSDFLAVDLKKALEYLGEITGSTVTEDILNRIFDNFCVGK